MATVVERDPAAELAAALGQTGETVTVTVEGKPREVTVAPLRLRQFSNVLKCVQRLRDAGVVEDGTLRAVLGERSVEKAQSGFDMMKMFLLGGDEIINIIIIATGLPAQAVDRLDIPDAVKIASAVFSVNLDFFFQNRDLITEALSPAVKAIETVAAEGVGAIGPPPSTDSEAQDTPSQK